MDMISSSMSMTVPMLDGHHIFMAVVANPQQPDSLVMCHQCSGLLESIHRFGKDLCKEGPVHTQLSHVELERHISKGSHRRREEDPLQIQQQWLKSEQVLSLSQKIKELKQEHDRYIRLIKGRSQKINEQQEYIEFMNMQKQSSEQSLDNVNRSIGSKFNEIMSGQYSEEHYNKMKRILNKKKETIIEKLQRKIDCLLNMVRRVRIYEEQCQRGQDWLLREDQLDQLFTFEFDMTDIKTILRQTCAELQAG